MFVPRRQDRVAKTLQRRHPTRKSSSHGEVGAPSFEESALLVFALGAKGGFDHWQRYTGPLVRSFRRLLGHIFRSRALLCLSIRLA